MRVPTFVKNAPVTSMSAVTCGYCFYRKRHVYMVQGILPGKYAGKALVEALRDDGKRVGLHVDTYVVRTTPEDFVRAELAADERKEAERKGFEASCRRKRISSYGGGVAYTPFAVKRPRVFVPDKLVPIERMEPELPF